MLNGSELRIPSIYVLFTHYVYIILMVISLQSILCSSFEIENPQTNHPKMTLTLLVCCQDKSTITDIINQTGITIGLG